MDEVLERLETTLISEDEKNGTKTNFENLYKYSGRLGNQEERRKEILEIQKSNRNDKVDRFRGILELVNAVEEETIFKTSRVYYRPNIYVAGFNQTSPSYSNVLMLSEWLIEKPVDFNDNWYVTPCPKGIRMLVVAHQGTTKCYSKYGQFRYEFRTELPGGNRCNAFRNKCCVLDCFYHEPNNTMYILDLLAWNNQPMTDCETEFRYFWLETKLAETPDLNMINKRNKVLFSLLPKVPCTPDLFNNFMNNYPAFPDNTPPIDGLLFYHKRAHYVAGETPLVGWLFPYMVQEVLGSEITVNIKYIIEKPLGYVKQADFIEKFEAKYQKKNTSRYFCRNSMDTSDSHHTQTKSLETNSNKNGAKETENMEAEENEIKEKKATTKCENMESDTVPINQVPEKKS
ncbi:snurportin-1 isoform X1 [Achroia grisella]|uniref:snurportin-1 isoform X1 n=1 Tax=Achroia grisella TaxID=688607 RepID=UPI0027D24D17|nr:snurportin-1 isoform X1 [Achroia grisella]